MFGSIERLTVKRWECNARAADGWSVTATFSATVAAGAAAKE